MLKVLFLTISFIFIISLLLSFQRLRKKEGKRRKKKKKKNTVMKDMNSFIHIFLFFRLKKNVKLLWLI